MYIELLFYILMGALTVALTKHFQTYQGDMAALPWVFGIFWPVALPGFLFVKGFAWLLNRYFPRS